MAPLSILGLVLVAVLAWFLGTDPMKISMHGQGLIADFKPHYIAPLPADTFKSFPLTHTTSCRMWKSSGRVNSMDLKAWRLTLKDEDPMRVSWTGALFDTTAPSLVGPRLPTRHKTGRKRAMQEL